MIFRRAVYVAMFPAAIILPLWVVIARGIVADLLAWELLAYFVIGGILFAMMAATAAVIAARKSARAARAVSWGDALVITATVVALFASGLWALPVLAVVDVLLVIGAFWLAVWELVSETRTRFRRFVDRIDPAIRPSARGEQAGQVIVIEPGRQ
jgi:hypothetical protein